MTGFRRAAQLGCLILFLAFLAAAGGFAGSSLFLRMDPSLVGITAIAGRAIAWAFLPTLLVLLSAPLLGRVFCGYICPMGTTIDLSDATFQPGKQAAPPAILSPNLKIYILVFLIGAAVLGVSFAFWTAPLALITRFYGTIVFPVIRLFSGQVVTAIRPVADWLDVRSLMFFEIASRKYATQFFLLAFFAAIFAAVKVSPRFWCRYLCPAGAILALLSRKPLVRRQVGANCNGCGKCARACPMGTISRDAPADIAHGECITCRSCEKACPQEAIRFSTEHRRAADPNIGVSAARRRLLLSGLAGAASAAVGLTGLTTVTSAKAEGQVAGPRLIRPPGALPEPDFITACVRCGQCITGCPTNTLQPVWFAAGAFGMFSPAITPQRRYCDPKCTVCGDACPTGAIRSVSPEERIWAKTGTAVIYRQKCLAWEHKKSCMVCDEVCPYDAVEFEKRSDLPYPVPHVVEDRCAGCGYCEHFCPVKNEAAIVVTAMGALRLKNRSYEEEGRIQGLSLKLRPKEKETRKTYPGMQIPDTESSDGMAPGFDEGL